MKKIFALLLTLAASVSWGAAHQNVVLTADQAYQIDHKDLINLKNSVGTVLKEAHNIAVGVYDYALTGGAIGQHSVGITLPSKSIVKNAWIDVITQPAGTGAFWGLDMQSTQDLYAYTARASLSAGQKQGIPDGTVGKMIKLTAARNIYAVVATAALTAGKIKVFVDYVVSE